MKKCKQGYYYCYTDEKCKPIPQGLKMTARFSGGGKEPEETGIDAPTNGNNQNGNGNGNGHSNGGSNGGGVSEGTLHKWFKGSKSKDGKGGWVNVVTGGTCASDEPGEGTPKCVSSAKRASMSKAERLSAQRRKKAADPGQQQKSGAAKPTYVSTDPKKKMKKEEMELLEYSGLVRSGIKVAGKRGGRAVQGGLKSGKTATKNAIQKNEAGKGEKIGKVIGGVVGGIAGGAAGAGAASIGTGIVGGEVGERVGGAIGRKFDKKKKEEVTEAKDKPGKGSGKKDACYHKVKSRYSVWPSAYASGALVKCRKVGADNWGNKSESYDFSNWREDFKATEYEFVDLIKPEPLKGEQIDEGQKCWKGYEKKGTKKMFGKTYNNCVKKEENEIDEAKHTPTKSDLESKIGGGNLKKLSKKASTRIDYDVDGDVDPNDKVEKKTGEYGEELPTPFGKFRTGDSKKVKVKKEEFSDWRAELDEDWQKVNKSDKTDGMSPAAVKAYRRENPGSKLKTAVTGDPKPGSKDAKRRKSFCARSKGQQDMHNIDCSKTPDKPVCKARRRWKC